ncbi:MAG: HD domain-containing protein [Trueperaceae bacterium]|nr:HD domain-containing protein [Trueperaceae bacterium]
MTVPVARLLLVEDAAGDERLFREMLRDLGYPAEAITVARSVGEAVERLADDTFDVLFLDLDLPDCQGLGTLERVLATGHDVPVVVLTGLADQTVGGDAVANGAQDYLVKGEVHGDVLARVIRYAVLRHQAITAAKQESARAAAAVARLQATQEARSALEHEVAERRIAQGSLERSLARLQAMRSIDRAIIGNHSVSPMLQVVLHEGVTLLHVDAATIMLVDETGDLVPAAHYGMPMLHGAEDRVPLDDPSMVAVRRDGRLSLDLHASTSARFSHGDRIRRAGFRAYHAVALCSRERLLGVLEVFCRSQLPQSQDWHDFVDTLADQSVVAIDSAGLQQQLVRANVDLVATYDATLDGWSRALDLRDRETEGHSRRVTQLSVELAARFALTEEELGHLRRGSLLHDIGKMGVPDAILQKPGPLDEGEWAIMRRHTTYARDLLMPIEFLRPAVAIPYGHHERWDGSGYPERSAADAIPLAARIFAVADVFDALTSDRSYRSAWSRSRALEYVRSESGRHFDPDVARVFIELAARRAPPRTS